MGLKDGCQVVRSCSTNLRSYACVTVFLPSYLPSRIDEFRLCINCIAQGGGSTFGPWNLTRNRGRGGSSLSSREQALG